MLEDLCSWVFSLRRGDNGTGITGIPSVFFGRVKDRLRTQRYIPRVLSRSQCGHGASSFCRLGSDGTMAPSWGGLDGGLAIVIPSRSRRHRWGRNMHKHLQSSILKDRRLYFARRRELYTTMFRACLVIDCHSLLLDITFSCRYSTLLPNVRRCILHTSTRLESLKICSEGLRIACTAHRQTHVPVAPVTDRLLQLATKRWSRVSLCRAVLASQSIPAQALNRAR
ncbi:hypothetical protein OE88DRAFT_202260 [Heliocybe sulcata]|uniref:Uncharacterized protein n=1 Tax=Heliocybe sulcata TaxID=5364 RepID=A0A5C3N0K1_9AGAM|nr:hypothetical protein OE88DRAFT_202260 [Heliocybe sulcata]